MAVNEVVIDGGKLDPQGEPPALGRERRQAGTIAVSRRAGRPGAATLDGRRAGASRPTTRPTATTSTRSAPRSAARPRSTVPRAATAGDAPWRAPCRRPSGPGRGAEVSRAGTARSGWPWPRSSPSPASALVAGGGRRRPGSARPRQLARPGVRPRRGPVCRAWAGSSATASEVECRARPARPAPTPAGAPRGAGRPVRVRDRRHRGRDAADEGLPLGLGGRPPRRRPADHAEGGRPDRRGPDQREPVQPAGARPERLLRRDAEPQRDDHAWSTRSSASAGPSCWPWCRSPRGATTGRSARAAAGSSSPCPRPTRSRSSTPRAGRSPPTCPAASAPIAWPSSPTAATSGSPAGRRGGRLGRHRARRDDDQDRGPDPDRAGAARPGLQRRQPVRLRDQLRRGHGLDHRRRVAPRGGRRPDRPPPGLDRLLVEGAASAYVTDDLDGTVTAIDPVARRVANRIEAEPGLGADPLHPRRPLGLRRQPGAEHGLRDRPGDQPHRPAARVEDGPDQVTFSDRVRLHPPPGQHNVVMISLKTAGQGRARRSRSYRSPPASSPPGAMDDPTPADSIVPAPGAAPCSSPTRGTGRSTTTRKACRPRWAPSTTTSASPGPSWSSTGASRERTRPGVYEIDRPARSARQVRRRLLPRPAPDRPFVPARRRARPRPRARPATGRRSTSSRSSPSPRTRAGDDVPPPVPARSGGREGAEGGPQRRGNPDVPGRRRLAGPATRPGDRPGHLWRRLPARRPGLYTRLVACESIGLSLNNAGH